MSGIRIGSGVTISGGIKVLPLITELYSFTSFTFTNAGITGRNGPTRANCLSSYNTATNTWLNNTAYFNVVTQGYQLWTVPATGSYRITSIGAAGGGTSSLSGKGAGARMIGVFNFTSGQKLKILVGQQGQDGSNACGSTKGGGGGGSFVVSEDNSTPYIIAGGGGGGSRHQVTNMNAVVATTGVAGSDSGGAGGSTGGGGGSVAGCVNGASGGGGFTGNGVTGNDTGTSGGLSFTNGGTGGTGGTQYGGSTAAGGFGGGGGSSSYMGGGGGGYSGGGSGGVASCSCSFVGVGGGAGSFNSGTSPTNTAAFNNTTHGSVLIEKL